MADLLPPDRLLQVLHGFNPWWQQRGWSTPTFRRLAWERTRELLDVSELRRAILLCGPRRVGKTTILEQLAQAAIEEDGVDPHTVCYLSLEHPYLKLVPLPEILRLYHEMVSPADRPTLLLLDEVHHADSWELHSKVLIDHSPHYRIVATGSAAVRQQQDLSDSGVGRWLTIPVPTLSFYEFLRIRGEAPSDVDVGLKPSTLFDAAPRDRSLLAQRMHGLLASFSRYLLVGGFPETARLSDLRLCQQLLREDVVERVLKRDMTALFGVRKIADLERLFIYLCLHTGGMLSVSDCASQLGTSATTVSNHLNLLEQAQLLYRLPPLSLGGKKVLKARNKYYLVDAALRNAVLLRGEELLTDADEMGLVVETVVLRHLIAFHYQDSPTIGYWNDAASRKEVDIVIQSPKYTIPIEVKYRQDSRPKSSDGMWVFCDREQVQRGFWITRADVDFDVVDAKDGSTEILRIPAHIFCYLLGQREHRR